VLKVSPLELKEKLRRTPFLQEKELLAPSLALYQIERPTCDFPTVKPLSPHEPRDSFCQAFEEKSLRVTTQESCGEGIPRGADVVHLPLVDASAPAPSTRETRAHDICALAKLRKTCADVRCDCFV
jgi:hypothetical protein